MNQGRTIFAQLMDFLPMDYFRKCVALYHGNYRARRFSCLDQFLAMAFAQLTFRESLRDIEVTLAPLRRKLYHAGFRSRISRSTLADANERRDCRIYEDFARSLIAVARQMYAGDALGADLKAAAFALDTTTIDVFMSLLPGEFYHQHSKSALKLHTMMNLRGSIPEVIFIGSPKTYDTCILDMISPIAGAFYVMDRGFIDFARLAALDAARAFFVVRARRKTKAKRRYSAPCDKDSGVISDQTVGLTHPVSRRAYSGALRKIKFKDPKNAKAIKLLTNNFTLPALTIAQLYKERWKIEVFFKWIKQNLRIKSFYGTSINAVKTQIWIAISVYVLVAIMKKQLGLEESMYQILQILSVSLFEKTRVQSAFRGDEQKNENPVFHNQLSLFQIQPDR
jgi:Domain of unknown function (DUF4372)/Transposase DDE domain